MVAQQPRAHLRNVAAPGGSSGSGYRQPVVPTKFASAKPLPPPPPGPLARELDSERSDEEGASAGSESRTEKQVVHRTGTPPGYSSLVVAGKVYHVQDDPNTPGLPSELEDITNTSHTMHGESVIPDENHFEVSPPMRKKPRSKAKGRSLAAPPAISSPVPFPQGDVSEGSARIDQSFEAQQQAFQHPHLHSSFPPEPEHAFVVQRSPSPSPPRDMKSSLLRRFRSRKSSAQQQPPIFIDPDPDPDHPPAETDTELHRIVSSVNEEDMRGRPRKPSFTEGLTRSLSGAYRSVRSGVGRRISLRRSESIARRENGNGRSIGTNKHDDKEDAVVAIVDRMRRNCTRAQSGFSSGIGSGSKETIHKGVEQKVLPGDLPPQWHVALKRDVDELLLRLAGGCVRICSSFHVNACQG